MATQGGTVHAPVIFLSWAIAVGADRYLIEYSADGRETWQPAGSGQSFINQHEFAAEVGLLTCRVAAVGAISGEWADIVVNAGGDFDTPGLVLPVLVEPFTGDALKVRWDPQPAAARYVVRVISHGIEVRSLYLERNISQYSYYYTDAQQDAAGRTLTVKVAAENGNGVLGAYGELTATNPPPAVPDNVEVTGLLNTLMVQCHHPDDTDLRELRVYGEQRSGFTPSPANLLATSKNALLSVPVPVNTRWWVRLAWVDQWGATDLNFSGEFEAEARQITETEIGPDSISTPMLKANAVTAGKVASDAITGREISATSTITAGTGNNTAGMNGSAYPNNALMENIRFWSGANVDNVKLAPFKVDKTGRLFSSNGVIDGTLYVGNGNELVGLSALNSDVRLWAGNINKDSAPFRVYQDGTIYAQKGEFEGTVYADHIIGDVYKTYLVDTLSSSFGTSWVTLVNANVTIHRVYCYISVSPIAINQPEDHTAYIELYINDVIQVSDNMRTTGGAARQMFSELTSVGTHIGTVNVKVKARMNSSSSSIGTRKIRVSTFQ
ncbi:hypothetical protein [Endozoicomonas sp. SCSIO W0465]|uniref:hypothetical protein n=1 Tax=Endozoicomonas sp. SCSIO W0465 TaxID=2918516 RepID=UPI002074F57F|nr:hypothetical protein [Endozoicomonas sp. SCSIO W0465]USE39256.1 hypothetical protein MJO57_14485 [Endozoicomonas sp. SCSIO W0465]